MRSAPRNASQPRTDPTPQYGASTSKALRTLYADGGVLRFYRGLAPALVQGPLSRFGDTASNAGMLSLLNTQDATKNLPVAVKTMAASVTAGVFRIALMPVDFLKTTLQVEGARGMPLIREKLRKGGPLVMFHGALGAAGATMVGHWPWFATYNTLSARETAALATTTTARGTDAPQTRRSPTRRRCGASCSATRASASRAPS